jgi:hypothetical protein
MRECCNARWPSTGRCRGSGSCQIASPNWSRAIILRSARVARTRAPSRMRGRTARESASIVECLLRVNRHALRGNRARYVENRKSDIRRQCAACVPRLGLISRRRCAPCRTIGLGGVADKRGMTRHFPAGRRRTCLDTPTGSIYARFSGGQNTGLYELDRSGPRWKSPQVELAAGDALPLYGF